MISEREMLTFKMYHVGTWLL